MKNVLFISWDGPESNYLDGLFLPIFEGLKEKGYQFHVIQFSWGPKKPSLEENIRKAGISYKRINIIRKPSIALGSFLSILLNRSTILHYIKKNNIDIVLPRSIFPLICTMSIKRKLKNVKLVFDADGLPLDEKIEFGSWSPKSILYRIFRDVEYIGLLNADLIVTRTEKAKEILYARVGDSISKEKIQIISNGRNPDLYKIFPEENNIQLKAQLGIKENEKVILYVGSAGKKYLAKEMVDFFNYYSSTTEAKFIFISNDPDNIQNIINNYSENVRNRIILKSLPVHEVPKYINCADICLAFIKSSFSMQAAIPIKVGEYLMCGKPVISTNSVGDTEEIFKKTGCGTIINEFNETTFEKAIQEIDSISKTKEELRAIGIEHFGIENSIQQYEKALNMLKF